MVLKGFLLAGGIVFFVLALLWAWASSFFDLLGIRVRVFHVIGICTLHPFGTLSVHPPRGDLDQKKPLDRLRSSWP